MGTRLLCFFLIKGSGSLIRYLRVVVTDGQLVLAERAVRLAYIDECFLNVHLVVFGFETAGR